MGLQNTLKALSDPVRREILNMLKSGRMSAGEITDKFDITGAAISRHLSVLKDADLIRDKREGKFIFYELNASVLEEIMLWIHDLKGDNNDEEKPSHVDHHINHNPFPHFSGTSSLEHASGSGCNTLER